MKRYVFVMPERERLYLVVSEPSAVGGDAESADDLPDLVTVGFAHGHHVGALWVEDPLSYLSAEYLFTQTRYGQTIGKSLLAFIEGQCSAEVYAEARRRANDETGMDDGDDEDVVETEDLPEEDLEENYRQGFEGHRG
jgi:hypothetical protein